MQKITFAGNNTAFKTWLGWLAEYGQGKTLAQFMDWLAKDNNRQKLEFPF